MKTIGARILAHSEKYGDWHAFRDAENGAGALQNRIKDPGATFEKGDGVSAARAAHGPKRGQLFPTLPTLLRIALVFGVGLDYFFVERKDRPSAAVIRKNDRMRFSDTPGRKNPAYFFESLDFPVTNRKMEAFYAEFPANAKATGPHKHKGAELIYVIKGQLAVDVDGSEVVLEEGDAMHLDSGMPHSYRRQGRSICSAVVVVAPK